MIRVLVAGLGNMGISHALAHHRLKASQIVGLVNRSEVTLPDELMHYPMFSSFENGMKSNPDLVVIATYSDSHADYACLAMEAGAHVFVEKPLATNVADAKRVVAKAKQTKRKLVIGYILRHHPSWMKLIEKTTSPIVDCGVHYVDVMCQITDAKPVRVHGMGVRLTDEIAEDMYNYGQFQVIFSDGTVGWYEAGWGPMMSETAFFVKDIVSPNGAVSITEGNKGESADIDGHTKVGGILVHTKTGDTLINMPDEPEHQALCDAEQAYILKAIDQNLDLSDHMSDGVNSLAICLAADESIRTGKLIELADVLS